MDIKEAIKAVQEVKKGINQKRQQIKQLKKSVQDFKKSVQDFKKVVKKKIKKMLIKGALIAILSAFLIIAFVAVVINLSNLLKNLYTSLTNIFKNGVSTFIKEDDEFWIDLEEKIELEVDGEMKKQTLVDHYLDQLLTMGVPLNTLNILGEADYTDPDLLKDKKNRKEVEKYIEEFIRADIISRQLHRTPGDKNVKSEKEEHMIDGGVYIYRTKDETTATTASKKDKTIYRMKYIKYEEFVELQNTVTDNMTEEEIQSLEEYFSEDPNTQELLFYKVDISEYQKSEYKLGVVEDKKTVSLNMERYDYQAVISEYTLPYEFLVDLCVITQNPEFVYHVCQLARDTKIDLLIQDNLTITETTEITSGDLMQSWRKMSVSNGINIGRQIGQGINSLGYTEGLVEVYKKDTVDVPHVSIMKVDAWSAALLNSYTNRIEQTTTEQEFNVGRVNLSYTDSSVETDPNDGTVTSITYNNYYGENCKTKVTETITSNTYEEAPVVDKIRKSKQFLGLMRNETGECPYDCFEDKTKVKDCVKEAVFKKEGINVKYKVPNETKVEDPLESLISGAKVLFLMLENTKLDNEEDSGSYAERMQGLKEYILYILSYPPNEDIDELLDDDELEEIVKDHEYNTGQNNDFWWPVNASNSPISSYFGIRDKHPVTGQANVMHNGIDIAVPEGTEVIATADGVVTFIETNPLSSTGLCIKIDHGNGIVSIYMHLSEIKVAVGQFVKQGQVIGLSGNTGRSTGPHLHFGMTVNGIYVDPLLYVSPTNKKPSSSGPDITGNMSVQAWKSYIEDAFAELGYTATEEKINRILKQIDTESHGNQNIIQGIKDSNSGTPIKFNGGVCPWCGSSGGCNNTNIGHGLLQFIPTTFNACKVNGHGNIFNGYDQIIALIANAETHGGTYTHIGNGIGWSPK